MLRHFVSPAVTNWHKLVVSTKLAFNSAWHEPVQDAPVHLNHRRHPRTPSGASLGTLFIRRAAQSRSPACAACMHRTCKLHSFVAQPRQKHCYDNRHMPADIAIASNVLLALPICTHKLISRWVEPSKVIACIGGKAYCLVFLACMCQIHNVFYISLIKQYRTDGNPTS